MVLQPMRKTAPRERFSSLFATCKAQTYHDPASRGPGVHRSVALFFFFIGMLPRCIHNTARGDLSVSACFGEIFGFSCGKDSFESRLTCSGFWLTCVF